LERVFPIQRRHPAFANEIFVQEIENNYFELKEQMKSLLANAEKTHKQMSKDQRFLSEYMEKLTDKVDSMENNIRKLESGSGFLNDLNSVGQGLLGSNIQEMNLESVQILPVDHPEVVDKTVHLPMGSYCKGTLLTGVHAPSDESNPLPVLIRLDEAFIGPVNTRIPLKGTFVLGKAYGDIVSERAYIQIIGLSTILPDGRTFENEGNLGYIGDKNASFGIKGEVVRSTGRELAMSFLTGFMSGASQAFADAETTSVVGSEGQVNRVVTGNATRNATFSGMSSSAAQLSEYYQGRVEDMIPSIRIESGTQLYFFVQKTNV